MTDVSHSNAVLPESTASPLTETTAPFVGRWNQLTSTTNWEKGRIICQWREALLEEGAPVTDYSDEAWTQIVGHVTSQHVGRLRRVYQRFGAAIDQYPDLFWSHFQAALDWDDAEMWLEGAIQNDWSVSQMRGKRWETHGTPHDEQSTGNGLSQPGDLEEGDLEEKPQNQSTSDPSSPNAPQSSSSQSDSSDQSETSTHDDSTSETDNDATGLERSGPNPSGTADPTIDPAAKKTARLDVAIEDLPDDIAEAFEQFKLAIIAQRRDGWRAISAESVVECLDALKDLALAEG